MKTANDNATVLHLDAVLAAFLPILALDARWMLEGWAGHLRATSHPVHAANSWAKHRADFAEWEGYAEALTVAHLVDDGLRVEAARELIRARVAARARKAAA